MPELATAPVTLAQARRAHRPQMFATREAARAAVKRLGPLAPDASTVSQGKQFAVRLRPFGPFLSQARWDMVK